MIRGEGKEEVDDDDDDGIITVKVVSNNEAVKTKYNPCLKLLGSFFFL